MCPFFFFFFQAEDGIRDLTVTGVQTCALPISAAAFGLLHLEWVHALLALMLGLWFGYVTERMGSALPSLAAHVINNSMFTLLTATVGTVTAFAPNVGLAVGSAVIFALCVAFVTRRRAPVAS